MNIEKIFSIKAYEGSKSQDQAIELFLRAVHKDLPWMQQYSWDQKLIHKRLTKGTNQGLSKHQIAGSLFIATAIVSRHVQNIYYKAQVSNRLELMRKLESRPP